MNPRTALLTSAAMAEADRLTVISGISGIALMESADRPVALPSMQRRALRRVILLCGPGGNVGVGFAAACRLAEADWPVRVAMRVPRKHLHGDAAQHTSPWRDPIEAPKTDALDGAALDGAELVVDTISGSAWAPWQECSP